ncbi:MAG: DeoR/GlpR family DNA-binding transcription regulator [Treponema sp.]|nr:DeoR/GlpR family DNA-binding transcription regulator [Treponema sp.]
MIFEQLYYIEEPLIKKLPYARRKEILDILKQNDFVDLRCLSEQLAVSYMTIHRDIEELERAGEVSRVYGGVKISGGKEKTAQEAPFPFPFKLSTDLTIEERFNELIESKRMIAKKAASLVREGDIIGMDPSTTTLHMCAYIGNMDITVFTTSLMAALQLSSSPSVKVILTGGLLRKPSMSLRAFNPQFADLGIRLNKCFLSSKAISFEDGLTDLTIEEPESKRLLARHSAETFVLVDHSKIGNTANYRVIDFSEMTAVITDSSKIMSRDQLDCLDRYREHKVRIIFSDE